MYMQPRHGYAACTWSIAMDIDMGIDMGMDMDGHGHGQGGGHRHVLDMHYYWAGKLGRFHALVS
jgi:hypothetical protein